MKNIGIMLIYLAMNFSFLSENYAQGDKERKNETQIDNKPARDEFIADINRRYQEMESEIEDFRIKLNEKGREVSDSLRMEFSELGARRKILGDKIKAYNVALEEDLEELKYETKSKFYELDQNLMRVRARARKEWEITEEKISGNYKDIKIRNKEARDQFVADLKVRTEEQRKKIDAMAAKIREQGKETSTIFSQEYKELQKDLDKMNQKLIEYNEASEKKLENLRKDAAERYETLKKKTKELGEKLDKELAGN